MPSVVRSILLVLIALSSGTAAADKPAVPPSAAPATATNPGVKTIIVVRHAEAEHQPGGDPALTADGRTRAVELARVLVDTPLHAVYRTHYQRSRETAAQLPRKAGDKATVIEDVPATVAAARAVPWGTTSLVIGHSNTISDLLRGLTGTALPADEPVLYDRIWIVTLARDGSTSLVRLRYGAPVPVPPP
ncbi:MAG TPA: histidine phosphatase family protein, partial [Kofleriaceae bacterium]|nr:histidine phosphatase family protein [Kofleriaceae bacterium]